MITENRSAHDYFLIVNERFARSLKSAHNPVFYALAPGMSIDKLLQKNIAHLSKEDIERTL